MPDQSQCCPGGLLLSILTGFSESFGARFPGHGDDAPKPLRVAMVLADLLSGIDRQAVPETLAVFLKARFAVEPFRVAQHLRT